MTRILVTILLIAAWHFPTTFFVPGGPPHEQGWFAWPFGRLTGPLVHGFSGVVAPSSPAVTTGPTLAMAAAGIASLAFIVAIAALWGLVVPTDWFRPAAVVGAASSIVLFLIYLGPWAIVPLVLDILVLWGILLAGWTTDTLAGA